MNTILVRDGLENRFATLFYVEIEPGRGTVRFLNAGHNPPLLVTRDAVEPLRAESPPLGMLAESRYTERVRDLPPGEMLIIYSDGVTEALDEREEEFGESRLRVLAESLRGLDAETAGRRLLDSLRAYMGD